MANGASTSSNGRNTTFHDFDTISSKPDTISSGVDYDSSKEKVSDRSHEKVAASNPPLILPATRNPNIRHPVNVSEFEIYENKIANDYDDIKVLDNNNFKDISTYTNVNTNDYNSDNNNNVSNLTHGIRTLQNLNNNTNNEIRLSPVRKTFTSRVLSLFPTKRPKFVVQR